MYNAAYALNEAGSLYRMLRQARQFGNDLMDEQLVIQKIKNWVQYAKELRLKHV